MHKITEQPFEVRINPSKRLMGILAAAHGIALLAGSMNALQPIIKILLAAGIVTNFYFALKKVKNAWHVIRYSEVSGWEIAENSGFESVRILKSTVLTRFAVWLHADSQKHSGLFGSGKRLILIMSDAISDEDFRRLIVKLKTTVTN